MPMSSSSVWTILPYFNGVSSAVGVAVRIESTDFIPSSRFHLRNLFKADLDSDPIGLMSPELQSYLVMYPLKA